VAQVSKAAPSGDASSIAALQHHGEKGLLKLDQYEYLLDVLFPIDRSMPLDLDYMMVLRFEPHLHPESQVVVRRWHDGRIEATIQQVVSGNAWRSAYALVTPGQPLDFPAMAQSVKVRENKVLLNDEQVRAWHQAMFPAIEQQFSHVRSVDREIGRKGKHQAESTGTRYEMWFIEQDDEVHAVAWDTEIDALPTGSYALTKWMNEVRFYAANHTVIKAPPKLAETQPVGGVSAKPE
jgi:hypothetical protein